MQTTTGGSVYKAGNLCVCKNPPLAGFFVSKGKVKVKLKAIINELNQIVAVDALFYALTNGGQQPGSILYESQDEFGHYTGFSIAVIESALKVSGKSDNFAFHALNNEGEALLTQLFLPAAAMNLQKTKQSLSGQLKADLSQAYLQDRLQASNHMQLIRAIQPQLDICSDYGEIPLGLFGGFAYDFIRQFEAVPNLSADVLQDVDYLFYLATRLFIVDHKQQKTYFVALTSAQNQCGQADLATMITLAKNTPTMRFAPVHLGKFISDTDEATYLANVENIKKHIEQGDAFQVVYGRMLSADFTGDAFKVYSTLKRLNTSPYMFYMRDEAGALLGCSPELCLGVSKKAQKRTVTITPIAGTKPRGLLDSNICPELDRRYAIALQTDSKELAEHVMLIDLARNDIAAIAKTGTTLVQDAFIIKRFSHVQHLVSCVSGELRDDVDALTAYLATMNMGTLTGAPKVEAMKIITQFEQNERGFFGGAFGFLTHDGHLETTIIIRSMRIKDGKVFCRAGAGIVMDSIASSEWLETEAKMRACVKALEEAACD